MFKPLFLSIGLRYIRAKRSNAFVSFISFSSMLGIALGVMVLVTVLSVMNGFSSKIQEKLLSDASHISIRTMDDSISDWEPIEKELLNHKEVINVEPYIEGQGMLIKSGANTPTLLRGLPHRNIIKIFSEQGSEINKNLTEQNPFHIYLSSKAAMALDAEIGDKITILIPEAAVSIAGIVPRIKRLTVAGIYKSKRQINGAQALLPLNIAKKIFKMKSGIKGIDIQLLEPLKVMSFINTLKPIFENYDDNLFYSTWIMNYSSFFDAIKMEKTVMWCILTMIIIVAAFNLIASLVMVVADKRKDIAVLRTIGITTREVMLIFITQGTVIGMIGTGLGLGLGLLLAINVTDLVAWLSELLQVNFIREDIYFIGYLPSEIRATDIMIVSFVSLLLSIFATIYPALQAAKVKPVEALRYD